MSDQPEPPQRRRRRRRLRRPPETVGGDGGGSGDATQSLVELLPEDMLLAVLTAVPSMRDLRAMSHTCKRAARLCEDVFRSRCALHGSATTV